MSLLKRLNRPWLHFLLLGFILFRAQAALFPEPLPMVGPLGETRIEGLREQWFATTGRLPSESQMAHMIQAELDRDMLFQHALSYDLHLYDTVVYQRLLRNMQFLQLAEGKSDEEAYQQALDMRLHLGDEVIKRRMVQVMEQLLLAAEPPPEPSADAVRAAFEARREELRRPPRYSLEHLYFSREREPEIAAIIARIDREKLEPSEARQFSSPFLPGYRFQQQTPAQLARHFGAAFVNNLEQARAEPGAWTGPLRSTYGMHYVWVDAIEPARDATLDEVEQQLRRDLESQARRDALAAAVTELRQSYEVIL